MSTGFTEAWRRWEAKENRSRGGVEKESYWAYRAHGGMEGKAVADVDEERQEKTQYHRRGVATVRLIFFRLWEIKNIIVFERVFSFVRIFWLKFYFDKFYQLLWSSGYDVCFTRRRSPVQTWPGVLFIEILFWQISKTEFREHRQDRNHPKTFTSIIMFTTTTRTSHPRKRNDEKKSIFQF